MALLIKITYPNTKIVFGGPQVTQSSSTRELLLKGGVADYLVLGEGEKPLEDIINAIKYGESVDSIIGVKTINNFDRLDTFYQEADLEALPPPDYDGLDFDKYLNSAIPIYSNRGCTFRCHFCSEHSLFGKKFKRRTPEKVINDIKILKAKYNIADFYFSDSLINASIGDEWMETFSDLAIESDDKFRWYGRFRAEMDEELIKKLKKTNLMTAGMGVESFSDITLQNMNKKKKEEHILRTIYSLIENDIKASINLFVGYPEETEKDFMKTFEATIYLYNDLKRLGKDSLMLFTIRTFELRPFSSIFNNYGKFGIKADTWIDYFSEEIFPIELKNVFEKTLYSFTVNGIHTSEAIHRLELLNQIKFKKDFYEAEF